MLQGEGKTSYFGVKDNLAYFTSSQDDARNIKSNTSGSFAASNKSEITGKIFYASVNVSKLSSIPEIQSMMGDNRDLLNPLFAKIDRFTISATDYLHYDVEFTTKEEISDFIKQFLK